MDTVHSLVLSIDRTIKMKCHHDDDILKDLSIPLKVLPDFLFSIHYYNIDNISNPFFENNRIDRTTSPSSRKIGIVIISPFIHSTFYYNPGFKTKKQ